MISLFFSRQRSEVGRVVNLSPGPWSEHIFRFSHSSICEFWGCSCGSEVSNSKHRKNGIYFKPTTGYLYDVKGCIKIEGSYVHRTLEIRQSSLAIVHGLHIKYEKHTKCRPQNLKGRNSLTIVRTIIKVILKKQNETRWNMPAILRRIRHAICSNLSGAFHVFSWITVMSFDRNHCPVVRRIFFLSSV